MKRCIVVICVMIIFLGMQSLSAQEPTWQAGAAKIMITPEKAMWMAGFASRNKPAEGKAIDLYAKALILDAPQGGRALMVSFDLIGMDRELSQKIVAAISARFDLPRERILLCFSHTHAGPMVGNNLKTMSFLDETQSKLVADYAAGLPDKVLAVLEEARKNLAPARLEVGRGHTGFAVNRRNNKPALVPKLRELGELKGPIDHDVPVMTIRRLDGTLHALVFGYACHATTIDQFQWDGDWPGYAQAEIESAHPGTVAVFWAGCGADQDPIPRRSTELARAYGKEMAQAVEEVVKAPLTPIAARFQAKYLEIKLPFDELPTREKLAQDMTHTNKFIASRAKHLMNELQTRGQLSSEYPYPLQAWRLGDDLTWLALGGEVVVDYSLRLKRELGYLWPIAYANDVMAYIPSVRVLREGGYEAVDSMVYYGQPTTWSPRIEQMIIDASTGLVRSLR